MKNLSYFFHIGYSMTFRTKIMSLKQNVQILLTDDCNLYLKHSEFISIKYVGYRITS